VSGGSLFLWVLPLLPLFNNHRILQRSCEPFKRPVPIDLVYPRPIRHSGGSNSYRLFPSSLLTGIISTGVHPGRWGITNRVIPYDVAVTTTDPAHPLVGPVPRLRPLVFWVPALLLKPEEVYSNYFVEGVVEWELSCMCTRV